MTTRPVSPYADWTPLLFGAAALLAGGLIATLVTRVANPLILLVMVVGLFFAFGTLVRTEWGLLALVFMTYTRFSDIAIKYHGAPSTAQPFIVLLVLVVLTRWLLLGERPMGWSRAGVLVGVYGLVGFASLLYARDFTLTSGAVSDYAKDALIAILITVLMQRALHLRRVIWALLAAGIFMGTITTFQYLTGSFANVYGGFGQAAVESIIGETNDYRISGPIGDANFYAQIMVVIVPLALERLWRETSPWLRLLALWALMVCVLSILFTFSRGGFIAMIAALAFLFVRRPPSLPVVLLTLVMGLALLRYAPAAYTERLMTIIDLLPGAGENARNEVSFRGRLSENAAAWKMFTDNPLLGVGWENYRVHYQEYSRLLGLDPRRESRPPHSLYLQIAAESGLVGLVVFGIIFWVVWQTLRRAKQDLLKAGLENDVSLVRAYQSALIGYFTAAVFLHAAYPRFLWLLIGIALATASVARNELIAQRQGGAHLPAGRRLAPASQREVSDGQ